MKKKCLSFTLLELLVVITIIVILASILLPALQKAKGNAMTIKCAGNMKQFGQAFAAYSADFNGYICPYDSVIGGKYWFRELLQDYLNDSRTLVILGGYSWSGGKRIDSPLACPSFKIPASGVGYSYGENIRFCHSYPDSWYTREAQIKRPSRACVLAEIVETATLPICFHYLDGGSNSYAQRFSHNGGENILFSDFHVSWMKRIRIPDQATDASAWKSSFWSPKDWTNDSW